VSPFNLMSKLVSVVQLLCKVRSRIVSKVGAISPVSACAEMSTHSYRQNRLYPLGINAHRHEICLVACCRNEDKTEKSLRTERRCSSSPCAKTLKGSVDKINAAGWSLHFAILPPMACYLSWDNPSASELSESIKKSLGKGIHSVRDNPSSQNWED